MRLILGLDAPTDGDVTVNGRHYRDHAAPLHEVGALLEARSVHTGRSAYNHLLGLAQTHGIPKSRVSEMIDLVGLHEVGRKRSGQFSLGNGPAPRHRGRAARRSEDGHARPSRSTVSTRRASTGSATSSRASPPRDAPSSSPPTS